MEGNACVVDVGVRVIDGAGVAVEDDDMVVVGSLHPNQPGVYMLKLR